jgi:hypothetical protein
MFWPLVLGGLAIAVALGKKKDVPAPPSGQNPTTLPVEGSSLVAGHDYHVILRTPLKNLDAPGDGDGRLSQDDFNQIIAAMAQMQFATGTTEDGNTIEADENDPFVWHIAATWAGPTGGLIPKTPDTSYVILGVTEINP